MKDAQPVGTSLEVLAAYLPYGIEVDLLRPRPYRAKLIALGQPRNYKCLYLDGHDPALLLADCLPVLRPFSQLATPLEDGTVPAAIDFVRSFVTDQYGMDWSEAHIDKVYENGDIMVSIPDRHPTRYDHYYVLHADWAGLPLEAYAWLIKNHFAVGLQPHQYIEKTPAAAPIIQEGTSQPK